MEVKLKNQGAPVRAPRTEHDHGRALTIVYTTGRSEPRFDWLMDGLSTQLEPEDDVEIIVVDTRGRRADELGFRPLPGITRMTVTKPKPCPWQGEQRVTGQDWWAASNARNTGIVLASSGYLAFLDDRCKLGPGWLSVVREGARRRDRVIAGSYDKLDEHQTIIDHRRMLAPGGRVDCGGAWLYGGTFSVSLDWLLEVNGLEEGMDGLAGEDCVLGHMLVNRGRRIDFVPDMYVRKERPRGAQEFAMSDPTRRRRTSGGNPESKSRVALNRFRGRKRTLMTPDLGAMRIDLGSGGRFPDVDSSTDHRDWFDGTPLSDMKPDA